MEELRGGNEQRVVEVLKSGNEETLSKLSKRVEADLNSLINGEQAGVDADAEPTEVDPLTAEEKIKRAEEILQSALQCVNAQDHASACELFAKGLEYWTQANGAEDEVLAKWYYLYGSSLYYNYRLNAQILGDKSDSLAAKQFEKLSEELCLEEKFRDEQSLQAAADEQPLQAMADDEEEDDSFVDEEQSDDDSVSACDEDELLTEDEVNEIQAEFQEDLQGDGELSEGSQVDADGELSSEDDQEVYEENNDLEIAWEVLEISRLIYSQKGEKKLALSDVHLLLGQICLEEEKFEAAESEIRRAIELRKEINDERAQAEAYFMMALVREIQKEDEDAIKNFQAAYDLIESTLKSGVSPEDQQDLEQSKREIQDRIEALKDVFTPAAEDEADYNSGNIPHMEQLKSILQAKKTAHTSDTASDEVNVLIPRKVSVRKAQEQLDNNFSASDIDTHLEEDQHESKKAKFD